MKLEFYVLKTTECHFCEVDTLATLLNPKINNNCAKQQINRRLFSKLIISYPRFLTV